MKKNLAFLLVVIFVLTAVLGVAPIASAEEEEIAAPSTEIAYFNISLRVGATLLFAVPSEGYTVNPDGTVDNLKLLITNDCNNKGIGGVADGELLEASGKYMIGGKEHIVFEYSGLAANELVEIVYARTLYIDENGFYNYGEAKGYSVTEFLKKYNGTDEDVNDLIDMLLAYGDAAIAYKPKVGAKANFLPSEARDEGIYTIKVKRVVNGVAIDDEYEINQFAKAGEITLSAPPVYGASVTSWEGAEVVDGKVTVSDDLELIANYTTDAAVLDFTYSSASDTVGSYKGLAGSNGTVTGAFTLGALWSAANRHDYAYCNFEVVEEDGAKCLKYAHNGAGELKLGANWLNRGIGDSLDFTLEVTVKANENGTFPHTSFRIDRIGDLNGQESNSSGVASELLVLSENGDIIMRDYFGNDVVLAKGNATKFQTITVACDVSENKFIGYVDGVKVAETVMNIENANIFASHYAGVNTRLRLTMYGGFQANGWREFNCYPAELVGEGKPFNFVEKEGGAYILDQDTGLYRQYFAEHSGEAEKYADAPRYDISYTAGDDLLNAVKEYVDANEYFYLAGAKVYIGNPMAD